MRRAAAALLLMALAGPATAAPRIEAASYDEPVARYRHGALGDGNEWGSLVLRLADCADCAPRDMRVRLPVTRVFEDIAPRLADLDGDGAPEAIVVESDLARGSRLAVYGPGGLIAATEFIGTAHRWLAPLGAGDLDGDGVVEAAFVDRPHLARILRLVQLRGGALVEVASVPGFTNHRFGEREIQGGFRNCGRRTEIVAARFDWQMLVALRWNGRRMTATEIGPDTSPAAFAAALACQ